MKITANFRRYGFLAAGAFVWLALLAWPVPPNFSLDASWQLVLGHARLECLQFGDDLITTYGPWGFLMTTYCHPAEFWPRIAWEIIFKISFVTLLIKAASRLSWWRTILLLITTALFLPYYTDAVYSLLIAGLLWSVATAEHTTRFCGGMIGAGLGFLALQKFTLFLLTGCGIAGVVFVLLLRRKSSSARWLSGSWLASILFFWVLAGQQLVTLPSFLAHTSEISTSYQEAMFLEESAGVFWCGVGCAALYAIVINLAARRTTGGAARVGLVLLGLGFGFLIWKQSFIRADGHVIGFFLFTLIAGLAAPATFVGIFLAGVSLLGVGLTNASLVTNAHNYLRLHLSDSVAALHSPITLHARFTAGMGKITAELALPALRAEIGNSTVDVFGHYQVSALLNGLKYRPRPIFQGYQACSTMLAELNASYYASPRAPDFILARLETIDNRLAALDDARALALLLQNYKLLAEEKEWLLLRRADSAVAATPVRTSLLATIGTPVAVPQSPGYDIWATISLSPSWLGRFRSFLYKPAEATLQLNVGPQVQSYRLTSRATSGGFLLTPLLVSTADLRAALQGVPRHTAHSLTITMAPSVQKFFATEARVTFAQYPTKRAYQP